MTHFSSFCKLQGFVLAFQVKNVPIVVHEDSHPENPRLPQVYAKLETLLLYMMIVVKDGEN